MTKALALQTACRLCDVTEHVARLECAEHIIRIWLNHRGSVLLVYRHDDTSTLRVVKDSPALRFMFDAYGSQP